jgi:beta-glucosidase
MSITPDFDDYYLADPLIKAVKNGEIREEEIDKKVRNILRFMLRVRMIEIEVKKSAGGKVSAKAVPVPDRDPGAYDTIGNKIFALAVARESVVLLKNEKKRLPILPEKTKRLLVIGDNANRMHANGGGSAEIKALYEITPLLGLAKVYGGNTQVEYVQGYYVPEKITTEENWQEDSIDASPVRDADKRDRRKIDAAEKAKIRKLKEEAVRKAKEYDEVIFVGGLNHDYDCEGMDRRDMKLPYGQDEVIDAVLKANPRTVIVMVAGSPVDMTAWKDRAKAILWMSYNGMEGGTALASVIAGYDNPSGKLPESMPVSFADTPVAKYGDFPGRKLNAAEKKQINAHLTQTFREGIFVGYRYYDKVGTKLQYPFGHGLSYTQFAYSGMTVRRSEKKNTLLEVSIRVKNTGDTEGAEVVQLYVGEKEPSKDNPVKELKGFEKIDLKPGQEKTVRFALDERAFSHYDEEASGWVRMSGAMNLYIGSSSADLRAKKTVKI